MKKIIFSLLPCVLLAFGCSGDKVIAGTEGTETESGPTVRCTDLNADIAVLRVLANEKVAGSTVTDYTEPVIRFSSGDTVSVAVRTSYDFAYANPTISVGSGNWIVDGEEIGSAFSDETLKIKGSKGYWYSYYGGEWHQMNQIFEGESIPVFAGISGDAESVCVKLTDGLEISFPLYTGSESISISETSASMAKEGESKSITVTSSSDWTAAVSDSWISVSAASGSSGASVTVTAEANEGSVRSGYVTFTSGDVSARFVISQDGEVGGGTIESDDQGTSEDIVSNTEFDRTIYITWSSSGATVTGDANNVVSISGGNVTVDNTVCSEKVIYQLSGTSSNGSFKVYSNNKQAFVLSGLNLTNPSGAAINNQGKKRCFVVVTGANTLADGSSAAYSATGTEDLKAVFFSEGQLIFSGSGSLTINANNAKGKAGLTSDDYIHFMSSPTVTVNAGSSAGNGVRGKDYILVSNGTVNSNVSAAMKKGFSSDSLVRFDGGLTTIKVTGGTALDEDGEYSGSAGIKADLLFEMTGGTVNITNSGAGGKGIKVGGSSTGGVYIGTSTISGGTLNIDVTGSNYSYTLNGTSDKVSAKGIKIGWSVKSSNQKTYSKMTGDLVIDGGIVNVTSSKSEAIEVKKTLTVNGGQVYASSSSDDAINSCSTMTINDGFVCALSAANDALDANGNLFIKGGVVMACGKANPDLGIDANTEGGFKLYVQGGTLFTLAGLESGASLSQSCYQASGVPSGGTWSALTAGSDTWLFKAPSSVSSPLVVSASSVPTLKNGVTVSGGTGYCNGYIRKGATVSGGSSVTLSSYTASGQTGPGQGGGGGGNKPKWL